MRLLWAVALVLMATACAASAADDPNWKKCAAGSAHPEDAVAGCTAIIDAGKDEDQAVRARAMRGSVLITLRKLDEALADLDIAVRLRPKWSPNYVLRGLAYFHKRQFDKSIADYNTAIGLAPNDAGGYSARANAYYRSGEKAQAIADYTRAIELAPERADQFRDRGIVYFAKRDFDAAIKDFSQALKLKPDDYVVLNNRCFARVAANKDLDKALSDCDQALALNPKAEIHDSRGFVFLRKGEFKTAIAEFDIALNGNPKAADALYKRGIAKLRSGDAAGGAADITAATVLDTGVAEEMANYGLTP